MKPVTSIGTRWSQLDMSDSEYESKHTLELWEQLKMECGYPRRPRRPAQEGIPLGLGRPYLTRETARDYVIH